MDTLPETDIDPSNGWLEYYFPIGEVYFQEICLFQGGYFEEDEECCYSTSNQGMDFSWIVCSNSSSLE